MDDLKILKSDQSPAVDFSFSKNIFKLSGESFMEDVSSFYSDVVENLEGHFATQQGAEILFIFDLDYFNSSSSRVIFKLFEMLNDTAQKGNVIKVEWYFDDDDIAEEAKELAEDFDNFEFKLISKD